MKIRHSIVTRAALFFTGLVIFSILLSGFLIYERSSKVIIDHSNKRITYVSQLAEQSFYALLREVSNDIAVIDSSPSLREYVENPTDRTTENIDDYFYTILHNKKSYFQIRYIGIANNGKEIIRFDKKNGQILKSDDLQEKGDRDYFKEAINIDEGELYFSKINLNEEYGVISDPQTPTLRAASPVFLNGEIKGIVIINVDLGDFYTRLQQISGLESQLFLIDDDGQYLYARNREKTFAKQRQSEFNFFGDFKIDKKEMVENVKIPEMINDDFLSYVTVLSYFKGKRTIYMVSLIDRNTLLKSAREVRLGSIKTLILVCVLSIIISWVFVKLLSKKLNRITKAISNYDKGVVSDIDLPVSERNEIGVLADAFLKMKNKIDQNVQQLNTALEKEKQAKMQRDEFLQNMSHEMRTPLNAILGFVELLYKNDPAKSQLPILDSLGRSARNLSGLVYDVLDHKKIVEGALKIEYQPTNLFKLLKEIYASYQYEALQKGLKFEMDIDRELEAKKLLTDPLRLSQIVTNLVVNAIKYTAEGSIKLEAKIISESQFQIKLLDTGIGIKAENLSKINDRYFREQDELSGRYGGYGLGLSIVKHLTGLFGGELKASSQKGIGSEFCVTMPLLEVSTEITEKNRVVQEFPMPVLKNQYEILHVEDDLSTIELIKFTLNDPQIKIVQIRKLEEAIRYAQEESADVIITDLMLERKNLKKPLSDLIRSKKISTPVIVTSALEINELKAVSEYYFQKPFQPSELKDLVFNMLGKNEFSIPDFSNIYQNYDYKTTKIKQVLQLMHEEFETYLNRINDAVETTDQEEWEAIIHKLITHINNLNLLSLLDTLPEQVERLNPDALFDIRNSFAYILCCIRAEKRRLSLEG